MTKKKAQNPLVCHGHTRPIVEVNYSHETSDGCFLVSASKDGQPMLRSGDTGDWIGTFTGHKGAVWSCVLNKPAVLAATGSGDFTARLWDACSGEEQHVFQHKHIVRTVAFSASTNQLLTGGQEKLLRLFDLGRLDAEPLQLTGAPSSIRCSQWIRDDNLILTSYLEHPNISVWDVRTQQIVATLPSSAPVTSIEVAPNGVSITTADGKSIKFWDASSLSLVHQHTLPYNVESATFAPNKRVFAAGGDDMWVRVHDFDTGEELECNKGHHGPVHTVRFGPTGDYYASGSEDGTIRIWALEPKEDDNGASTPIGPGDSPAAT